MAGDHPAARAAVSPQGLGMWAQAVTLGAADRDSSSVSTASRGHLLSLAKALSAVGSAFAVR